jgi:hypothetical protein
MKRLLTAITCIAIITSGCTETRGKDLTVKLPSSLALSVLQASLPDPAFKFDTSASPGSIDTYFHPNNDLRHFTIQAGNVTYLLPGYIGTTIFTRYESPGRTALSLNFQWASEDYAGAKQKLDAIRKAFNTIRNNVPNSGSTDRYSTEILVGKCSYGVTVSLSSYGAKRTADLALTFFTTDKFCPA